MKMIIRADDFGFSEAVNYGILKAFQGGLVKNIGLMSNMPYAKQAFDMIREENVTLGLHINLILGSPCARPEQIPSLLNMDGKFLSSRVRRREMEEGIDNFVYEDTVVEVKAHGGTVFVHLRQITGLYRCSCGMHRDNRKSHLRYCGCLWNRYKRTY